MKTDKRFDNIKILFLGNFNDQKIEGTIKIINRLKDHFEKKHQLTKSKDCDIVNIHSSGFFESLKYKPKKNYIYSLHSNIAPLYFRYFNDMYRYYKYVHKKTSDHVNFFDRTAKMTFRVFSHFIPLSVKRLFLRKFPLVILPNEWMKKKLGLKNSIVIHHGIDTNRFVPKNINNKKLRLRYFGHPSFGKGFHVLAKAFSRIGDDYIKEIFFTQKNDRIVSYLKSICPDIKIHGPVKDIIKEYHRSDIIIQPYQHSSGAIATPLVLLEAMSCEKAVITSSLPHIKEICADTVRYVNPKRPEDIVKQIRFFTSESRRREYAMKARKRVISHYDEKDMFEGYEKAYLSILK